MHPERKVHQGPVSACIPGKPAGWLGEPNCASLGESNGKKSDNAVRPHPLFSLQDTRSLKQGTIVAGDAGDYD
jgi:hypothetical protein